MDSIRCAAGIGLGAVLLFVHGAAQAGSGVELSVPFRARGPAHIYVDDDASGVHDGSSWCDAYVHLQDALDAARESGGLITEIHVAQGVYKPDQGRGQTPGDRTATFELMSGVALLGGYAGRGAVDPDDRDPIVFQAMLSGDLASNDVFDAVAQSDCCTARHIPACDAPACQATVCVDSPHCCDYWEPGCAMNAQRLCCDVCRPTRCDNSYHVVTASGSGSSGVLDGLVIAGGEANGEGPDFEGGGLYSYESSPTITDCVFTRNAAGNGGAVYARYGRPVVLRSTFADNGWSLDEGPYAFVSESSEPAITDCAFLYNRGGGLYTQGYTQGKIVGCSFVGNTSTGLLLLHGAPNIIDCAFIGNKGAYQGGGMGNDWGYPQLVNCVFYGNSAGDSGGGYGALGAV